MICNKTPNKFRGSGGGRFDYPPHPHVMSGDRHSPPSYNQDPTPAEAFGNRNSFPTPFPYKVAKALMPDIYRNMEFDAWNEAKKDQDEITCGEGDQQFACGDKCQVNLEGHPERVFNAHIQDIKSRKGPVVVFVLELGERHEVLLSSLIPLPQVHNQDIPNKRRSKKKDFSLVVPVPGRQQHSLPPRLCSQSSLGSKEASSDCSSPSGSMGRASSPAGFQTRPRSNFVKRHLINSAGHLIKGSWAPMNNRWWCGRTRPPHRGYFRFGRPEEEVAGNAYCHSPDYEDGQAQYSEEQRADSEAVLNIPLNRSNEECGASSQMMPPGVYPSAGGGPNVMPSPCVFPSTAACPAAPPGSSPTARGGSAFPPPPPNYLASSPPYSYFIVPYHESMVHGGAGPVNYAAAPSYDPSGMDLPQRDMSTLRFFFNLGVEYYHMCSYLQQQQHQQRFMASFAPPPPVTYSVPIQSGQQPQRSCEQLTSVPPPPLIEEGQCAVVKEHATKEEKGQEEEGEEAFPLHAPPSPCSSTEHCRCELPSSSQDSGCLSDICSGHSDEAAPHEEEEEEEEEEEAQEEETRSSSSSPSSSSPEGAVRLTSVPFEKFLVQSPAKSRPVTANKSNRPLKLVRPIKDIPPRFKKLLEAANAQKTAAIRSRQLEGLPLVRQLGPNGKSKQHLVQQPLSPSCQVQAQHPQELICCNEQPTQFTAHSTFNPNAQSFVPGQPYEASDAASSSSCTTADVAAVPVESSAVVECSSVQFEHPLSPYDHTMLLAPPPGPTYTIHIINGQGVPSFSDASAAPPIYPTHLAYCPVSSSTGSAAAYAPSSPAGGQTYIHYMPVSAASPQGHPLPPPPPPPMVPPPLKTASLPAPPLSAASSSSSSSSSSQSYPAAAPAAVPAPFPA
ncbi:hypothetical protein CAPTEDRAFT_222830 [Capitella teleta]|uniref:Uncharacterized protein n=1 Tax=Capitella teleta TaxID=283909 RepID=R7TJZ4_CAPTE|nr:hypothetical protein CAPTEDRAFT_222830 [Capitella teleta]|eukprot:ELT94044.1 hypothetical protein CAPTEDRAFT_222830 [Capitella teleta]